MSRVSICPVSYAMGQCGGGAFRVEDATRLFRMLYTPARIALVAAILGAVMFLALQYANPAPLFSGTGAGTSSHFTMGVSTSDNTNADVDRQARQLLAELEQRYGTSDDPESGPRP
jgi:hypothetical protein